MSKKYPLWRIYAPSTIITFGLLVYAAIQTGLSGFLVVVTLAVLEVSLSFDNAVVNARILKKMSAGWQKAFLTIGILIAVFGVRIILPIILVAAAIGGSFGAVLDMALNNPTEYGHKLHEAHPMIASFGGMFLLMLFLEYFLEKRKTMWLPWFERKMQFLGNIRGMSAVVAAATLLGALQLVDTAHRETVLVAGLSGMLVFLAIHTVDALLKKSGVEKSLAKGANATFRAGLIGFIYLEVIDASFSLDGVIGAFAITNQVLLIAIGLGIGAIYVRTITVHMLRRGVLDAYRFIEHGAHYAIGILATIMLLSLKFEIPEVITGLTGASVIIVSVIFSIKANRKDSQKLTTSK